MRLFKILVISIGHIIPRNIKRVLISRMNKVIYLLNSTKKVLESQFSLENTFEHKLLIDSDITISAIVPVHNPNIDWFTQLLLSLKNCNFNDLIFIYSGKNISKLISITSKILPNSINLTAELITGIADKTNLGIQNTKSDYFVLIDHDDLVIPNADKLLREAIRKQGLPDIIVTDHDVIPENAKITDCFKNFDSYKPKSLDISWFTQTNYWVHAIAMKTEAVKSVGCMDPNFEFAQDYELWLRMLNSPNTKASYAPIKLYAWRSHRNSVAVGSLAKPEIISNASMAIKQFFEFKGVDVIVEDVKVNGRSKGVYRAKPKNSTSWKFSLCKTSKCITNDQSQLDSNLKFTTYTDWILVMPNCMESKNFRLCEGTLLHSEYVDKDAGVIGIPCFDSTHDYSIYNALDDYSNLKRFSSSEDGAYSENIVLRKVQVLSTPVFLIRKDLFLTWSDQLKLEPCLTIGTLVSKLAQDIGINVYLDGQCYADLSQNWVESHDNFLTRNLYKLVESA